MVAIIFKIPERCRNTYGLRYGESSPVEIIMKIDVAERAMFFFRDGGQNGHK